MLGDVVEYEIDDFDLVTVAALVVEEFGDGLFDGGLVQADDGEDEVVEAAGVF